jgi:hypothetical protein
MLTQKGRVCLLKRVGLDVMNLLSCWLLLDALIYVLYVEVIFWKNHAMKLKLLDGLLFFWWTVTGFASSIPSSELATFCWLVCYSVCSWCRIEFHLLCMCFYVIYRRCILPNKSCLWKGYCGGVPKLVISSCGLECDTALTQKLYATLACSRLVIGQGCYYSFTHTKQTQ